jgi:ABC-type phosphate transport system permease subunit
VLETRTEFGARVSAPLLAMGTGLLLSGCRIVPPTAPVYDLAGFCSGDANGSVPLSS